MTCCFGEQLTSRSEVTGSFSACSYLLMECRNAPSGPFYGLEAQGDNRCVWAPINNAAFVRTKEQSLAFFSPSFYKISPAVEIYTC